MKPETPASVDGAIDHHTKKVVAVSQLRAATRNRDVAKLLQRWRCEIEIEDRVNARADKFIGVLALVLGIALLVVGGIKFHEVAMAKAIPLVLFARYAFLAMNRPGYCGGPLV